MSSPFYTILYRIRQCPVVDEAPCRCGVALSMRWRAKRARVASPPRVWSPSRVRLAERRPVRAMCIGQEAAVDTNNRRRTRDPYGSVRYANVGVRGASNVEKR